MALHINYINKNGRFGVNTDSEYDDDPDFRMSWGTRNRGYKLFNQYEWDGIPSSFFAFITEQTHYVYDFTNFEVYPKFSATGQYVQYPSMHYRNCTLPTNNTGLIFVPNFKTVQEIILGFFVRVLPFSLTRFNEQESTEDEDGNNINTEIIYSDATDTPMGHSSPILLTNMNVYPISAGLTTYNSGSQGKDKYIRENINNKSMWDTTSYSDDDEKNGLVVFGGLPVGRINSLKYEYEVSESSSIHGWKNWSFIPSMMPMEYMVLGYLKCISWNTIAYTTYMASYEILRKGTISNLDFTISPIFFPSVIFYPIPLISNVQTSCFFVGTKLEGLFKELSSGLSTINNSEKYSIDNDNLAITAKIEKDLHLNYYNIRNVHLRPLCINVTYRGFLPYYLQQSF